MTTKSNKRRVAVAMFLHFIELLAAYTTSRTKFTSRQWPKLAFGCLAALNQADDEANGLVSALTISFSDR